MAPDREEPLTHQPALSHPIRLTRQDGILTVTLARPDSGNALDIALAHALREACESGRDDPAIDAMILDAEGGRFCVGGDIVAMIESGDPAAYVSDLVDEVHRALQVVAESDLPVISAIDGAVAGGGLGLALIADIALATESSRFVPAYAGIGLSPDCGVSYLLPRAIGLRDASRLLLGGPPLSASEARAAGLVHEVFVDRAHLAAQARAKADSIRANAAASRAAVRLLRRTWAGPFEEHLRAERESIVALAGSAGFLRRAEEFQRNRNR